ncbi:MAG: glycosyltransferase, partial [Candidatus Sumerlaeia bacterium]|nr:glycosyltransferase [Candidatus Sumerlaeia bacterium]
DVDTLYKGIVYAMERNPQIEYVSTGGSISGHDEITFEKFRQLVLNSVYRERFHFVGWVELALLPQYYYEANAAINIDYFSYEGLLGCRNRIFDWLICELPVITTALSEITQLLAKKELVTSFPIGDSQALGKLILDLAQNIDKHKERARRAREFLIKEYTNDRLLAPLVAWARNPSHAPDLINKDARQNPLMTAQLNLVRQGGLLQSLQEQLTATEAKLNTIKGSRAFRLLNKFKKFL